MRVEKSILLGAVSFFIFQGCATEGEGRVPEHYVAPSQGAQGNEIDSEALNKPAPSNKEELVSSPSQKVQFTTTCKDAAGAIIPQSDPRFRECFKKENGMKAEPTEQQKP